MVAKVSTYTEYHHPLPIRKHISREYMDPSASFSSSVEVLAKKSSNLPLSMISFNPWPGEMNFQIKCQEPSDRCPSHARSDMLQKIFVQKDTPLVIEVSISKGRKYEDFTVRAAAVYSRPSEVHEPVKRCLNHSIKDQYTSNGSQNTSAEHFIRSDYPKSKYEEDPSTGRLSVLTPLFEPQPGSDETLLVYRFMCLNSCINRRPIRIVFSLEKNNIVIGSHSIDVRVCACPARDLALEEKRHRIKRSKREDVRGGSPSSSDEAAPLTTKKRRRDAVEEDEDQIEMLPVRGQKMTNIMKFLLERLMLAEKCLQVHPELMDEVKRETEELSQLNSRVKKKKVTLSSRPAKLSAKLASIQAIMSVESTIQAASALNVTSNIQPEKPEVTAQSFTQAERTKTHFTANVNSIPEINKPATPSVSVESHLNPASYEIPLTQVTLASAIQPVTPPVSVESHSDPVNYEVTKTHVTSVSEIQTSMPIIPEIHIKDEPI